MNWKWTLLLLLPLLVSCTDNSAEKQNNANARNAFALGLLSTARSGSTTASSSVPTCEVASPPFSSLREAGFDTGCGRSGCHNGAVSYNTTNYSQVRALTAPGNASQSLLYTKQSTGSMRVYTTTAIDKAIFCWIQGGSNP